MFKWNDKFSCNIDAIDTQHKKLFQLGEELYTIASINDNYDHYDDIVNALNALRDYTIYHFQYEEKILEENKCPELIRQLREHRAFVKKLEDIDLNDIENDQYNVIIDLLKFISTWIRNHIYKSDKCYQNFLNEKGIY